MNARDASMNAERHRWFDWERNINMIPKFVEEKGIRLH